MKFDFVVGLVNKYKVEVDTDEKVVKVYDYDGVIVKTDEFDSVFDIIDTIEKITLLTTDDINEIVDRCESYGL